jgi:ferric-dicitrate binding protein FerR (iron transport regulator)
VEAVHWLGVLDEEPPSATRLAEIQCWLQDAHHLRTFAKLMVQSRRGRKDLYLQLRRRLITRTLVALVLGVLVGVELALIAGIHV